MDPVSLIRSCVIIVHIIVQIESDAKYNSIELKRLFNRVKALEQPLTILSKKQSNDLTSRHDALNNVLSTLNDVEEFLMKHQNDNAFDKFTNAAMHGNTQIINLNVRIDQCLNVLELAVTTSITQQVDDVNRKLDLLLQVSQQLQLNNINNNNTDNNTNNISTSSNVENSNEINISTNDSTLKQQQAAVVSSPNNNDNISTYNNNQPSSSTSNIALVSNFDTSFQQQQQPPPPPLLYSTITATITATSTATSEVDCSNNDDDNMSGINLQTISSTGNFYDPNTTTVSTQPSITYSSQLSSSPSQYPVQYQDSNLQYQDSNLLYEDSSLHLASQYQDSTTFQYQNQSQYNLSQQNLSPSYTLQNNIEPSSFNYLTSQQQSTTSYSPPTPIYLTSTTQYQDSNNNNNHNNNHHQQYINNLPPSPPQQQYQYDQGAIYMNSTPSQTTIIQSQQLPTPPPLQLQQTNYHLQQYQQQTEPDDYYNNLDKSSKSRCGCIMF